MSNWPGQWSSDMGLRASASAAERAARDLAHRGPGWFSRRERATGRLVDDFVAHALEVPPGGVLPPNVRQDLGGAIDRIIDALEDYLGRDGHRTRRRTLHDTEVAKQIYALREAEQNLLHNRHLVEPVRASRRMGGDECRSR